jgi:hypothetical protein
VTRCTRPKCLRGYPAACQSNTRSSYCVSVVGVRKIWWVWVGTLSDLATLLWLSNTEGLPTAALVLRRDVGRCCTNMWLQWKF